MATLPQLTDVRGIGPETAKKLAELGMDNVEALANASIEAISKVPGFGAARATEIRADAARLIGAAPQTDTPAPPAPATVKNAKRSDKISMKTDPPQEPERTSEKKVDKKKDDKNKADKKDKKDGKKKDGKKKKKDGKKKDSKKKDGKKKDGKRKDGDKKDGKKKKKDGKKKKN